VSSTIGLRARSGRFVSWPQYGKVWVTWWLGDATGRSFWPPALLLWRNTHSRDGTPFAGLKRSPCSTRYHHRAPRRLRRSQSRQRDPLPAALLPDAVFRLGGASLAPRGGHPRSFCVRRRVGHAPWVRAVREGTWDESLLLLSGVHGITSSCLSLRPRPGAAAVEGRLRHLAMSDPAHGLGNLSRPGFGYRHRDRPRQRTERSFSIPVADLDGLKVIHDRYGPPGRSRALRRVAEALRF